jgi:hypothetical protein
MKENRLKSLEKSLEFKFFMGFRNFWGGQNQKIFKQKHPLPVSWNMDILSRQSYFQF